MGWSGALFAIFQIGLVVLVGGAGLLLATRSASRAHRLLLGAGEPMGLKPVHTGKLTKSAVFGHVDGFSVKVEMSPAGRVLVEIDGAGVISPSLHIEPPWGVLHGQVPTLAYGDWPSHKSTHQIGGPDLLVLARLDDRLRALLVDPPHGGSFRLSEGMLRLEVRRPSFAQKDVFALIRTLVSVAEALDEGRTTVPEALLDRVEHDPDPWARARCLEILCERLPSTQELQAALSVAASDEAPEVEIVLWSFSHCEEPAELAELLRDSNVFSVLRTNAIRRLGSREDQERFVQSLGSLIGVKEVSIASEVIRTLGSMVLPERVEVLEPVLKTDRNELLITLATTLGTFGDARAEPLLLALLSKAELVVHPSILAALGKVGEDAALNALVRYCDDLANGPLEQIDLVQAEAKAALKRIRSRLGRTDGGRLSVLELEPEGALEYSDVPPRGAVSDPDRA